MIGHGPRMLADEMLGKVARELRALGFDVAYVRDLDDEDVLARARDEDRLLLTRDRRLAQRAGDAGILVEGLDPEVQLVRLVEALELRPSRSAFLSRCLVCNTALDRIPEAEGCELARAGGPIPEDVAGQPAWRCQDCQRVYWRGTHVEDMLERLGHLLTAGPGEPRPPQDRNP